MNLSEFKILKEDHDSYEVGHPSGKSISIAKKGMSEKAHAAIKKMCSGGMAHYDEGTINGPVSQQDIPGSGFSVETQQESPQMQNVASAIVPQFQPLPEQTNASKTPANNDNPTLAPAQTTFNGNPNQLLNDKNQTVVGALKEQKAALGQEAKAIGQEGAEETQAIKDYQDKISKITPDDIVAQYKPKDDAFAKAYADAKADPKRYYKDQSIPAKIASAMALFIGGAGAASAHQENLAAKTIEDNINRDIDAQKSDQSKILNAWKMNREMLGSDIQANLATKNQMYTGLKVDLMKAAANAKGPQALARIQQGMALVDQQIGQNQQELGLRQWAMGKGMEPGKYVGEDPAFLVPRLVPPDRQAKVFEEIQAAQNTRKNSAAIMQAFDNAAKDTRVMSGGQFKNMIPGVGSAYNKELEALMGPTFADVEHTVRQAAMDNMANNTHPQALDSDETIARKRSALEGYLKSKESAPTATGFGIPLRNFRSTSIDNTGVKANRNGVQYQYVK